MDANEDQVWPPLTTTPDEVPKDARPPQFKPPRPKTPQEQKVDHEEEETKETVMSWLQARSEAWVRLAAPIGDRDSIIDGIFEAILADRETDPSSRPGVVGHAWLKSQIDNYNLKTLDQDVRHAVKKKLEQNGFRVSD